LGEGSQGSQEVTFDPSKRDSTWTQVLPGCYFDPAGAPHLFPDEFLAYLSVAHPEAGFDPNSKADYDAVVAHFTAVIRGLDPGAAICMIEHEREQN
jgi:hypothetical protein